MQTEGSNPLQLVDLVESIMFYLLDEGPAMLNLACASKLHNRIVHSSSAWIRHGFNKDFLLENDQQKDYLSGKTVSTILGKRYMIKMKRKFELIEAKFGSDNQMDYINLYPSLNISDEAAEPLARVCEYAFNVLTVHELVDVIRLTKDELKRQPARSPIKRRTEVTISTGEKYDQSDETFSAACTIRRPYVKKKKSYVYQITCHSGPLYFEGLVYKNYCPDGKKSMTMLNLNAESSEDNRFGLHRFNHETDTIEIGGELLDFMQTNTLDYNAAKNNLWEFLGSPTDSLELIQISHFDDGYDTTTIVGKEETLLLKNIKLGKQ